MDTFFFFLLLNFVNDVLFWDMTADDTTVWPKPLLMGDVNDTGVVGVEGGLWKYKNTGVW